MPIRTPVGSAIDSHLTLPCSFKARPCQDGMRNLLAVLLTLQASRIMRYGSARCTAPDCNFATCAAAVRALLLAASAAPLNNMRMCSACATLATRKLSSQATLPTAADRTLRAAAVDRRHSADEHTEVLMLAAPRDTLPAAALCRSLLRSSWIPSTLILRRC